MTIETFGQAVHATPFVPFTLYLADGRSFHVVHPDYVSYHPKGRTVTVHPFDRPDAPEQIDLLLVVSIGPPAAPAPASAG